MTQPAPPRSRMGSLDALFLYAEDGTAHMHIGSCATFAGPAPSRASLSALVDSKLHLVTRFRQRVRFVPGSLGRPIWVDDPGFVLAEHLHAVTLAEPGDDSALEALMSELMTDELPRDRPLWDMWLVDGLTHDRWALVSKVHHCMVDGVAGTDLLAAILDVSADAAVGTPLPWDPARPPSDVRLIVDAVVDTTLQPLRAVAEVARGSRSASQLVQSARDTAAGLWSFGKLLAPRPAARSLTGAIGSQRRWAVGRCELADLQGIRSVFSGSINDVVIAAVTGAFRELITQHGETSDTVRLAALVPVSVRSGHDHVPDNQVSMMIAELPVDVADPLDRLAAVYTRMQQLKASHQIDAGTSLIQSMDLLPSALYAMVVRATISILRRAPQHTVNTVITNVPGPQQPLYALGSEMLEYLPYVPIGEGLRLGVAVVSYNGRCSFGVTGDDSNEDDVHLLAGQIEAMVDQLRALAQPAPRRRTSRR